MSDAVAIKIEWCRVGDLEDAKIEIQGVPPAEAVALVAALKSAMLSQRKEG